LSIFLRIRWYNIPEVRKVRPLKEKISITLDNDLLAKLREKADEDDRSLSQYINLILKKNLEEQSQNEV
jgi:hypothetical protein